MSASPYNQPFSSTEEAGPLHGGRHVASLRLYRSRERTNQTLTPKRTFHALRALSTEHLHTEPLISDNKLYNTEVLLFIYLL